jgi:hypothetical protein
MPQSLDVSPNLVVRKSKVSRKIISSSSPFPINKLKEVSDENHKMKFNFACIYSHIENWYYYYYYCREKTLCLSYIYVKTVTYKLRFCYC